MYVCPILINVEKRTVFGFTQWYVTAHFTPPWCLLQVFEHLSKYDLTADSYPRVRNTHCNRKPRWNFGTCLFIPGVEITPTFLVVSRTS